MYTKISQYVFFDSVNWMFLKYYNVTKLKFFILTTLSTKISFIPKFYKLTDLIWQDGLLIDFLQKKVLDKWVRRFLIYSSYLFSERVMFKFVVRFYIDYIVWPVTFSSIFELTNVSWMLHMGMLAIMFLIVVFNLTYVYSFINF